jgi:pimeloyl-ACP methyl ester carboxylesterase
VAWRHALARGSAAIFHTLDRPHALKRRARSNFEPVALVRVPLAVLSERLCRWEICRRPAYTHLLSLIKVPTLIIVGIEDTMTPLELAQQMDKAIANSRLAYIRGAAHVTSIERPEQFNRASRRGSAIRWK